MCELCSCLCQALEEADKFAVVLAEAPDRVSRDQADVAILYKHLKFAGVRIVTLADMPNDKNRKVSIDASSSDKEHDA